MSLLGVLVLAQVAPASATAGALAADLFAEGRWQECIRECERSLLDEPAQLAPRVLGAIARLRLGGATSATLLQLEQAAGAATNDLTALAAFEIGRALWRQGAATNAFTWTRRAFRTAAQPDLFARSGCLLAEIVRQHPGLGRGDALLLQTLETCRPLWTPEVVRDALAPPSVADDVEAASGRFPSDKRPEAASTFLPVRWIVAIYRTQIRPAIGSRCSLTPSCSEYFRQAGQKHGLLAFPIVADRLVREPGVVQAAEHPVTMGETVRFADPLDQHDYWLRAKGTGK